MGDDFTRAQLATYARVVPDMDVIITTAMIPNRSAPELITAEMVVPWKLLSYFFPLGKKRSTVNREPIRRKWVSCAWYLEMYTLDQMEGCYYLRFQMVETPTLPKQNFRVLMDSLGLGRV